MRIPFPKTIPLGRLLIALAAVLLVQLIQGTDPAFAFLMLVAQVAAVVGFNRLGGMTQMAGAFCLCAVLPNVTVPEITHILLGQPGDFSLQHPLMTAGVCAVFFICIMLAAVMVSLIRHPVPLLDHFYFSITELRIVSILSSVTAISISIKILTLSEQVQDGSLLAALNHFVPSLFAVGVMLATYVRIVTTNGASAVSWYVALVLMLSTVPGFLIAGKEGILTPFLCWFFVVAASRYRFSLLGTIGAATVVLVAWVFVYPFSQNARNVIRESETISQRVDLIIQYFRDPSLFPDTVSNFEESSEFGTAGSKVKIINRYSVLKTNDMLIDGDLKSGYTSIDRYAPALLSVVPHALWPDRPDSIHSNELGHKAGFNMGDADSETGITIGSPAMFFDLGGWLALIVYTVIFFTVFFFAVVRLVSTTETSIWGLVPVGTEAILAGACSPSSMFYLLVMVLGMFFLMIAILKTISYVTEALIAKPVSF